MKLPVIKIPRPVRILASLILALIAALAIDDAVSRPTLTEFDPARMGQLEASMWRSYYEHRWTALAVHGLNVSCGEYGFSLWDGLRTSILAARAAHHFRKSTNDPRCLPLLERYYEIIADGLGKRFDAREAARLELEWWRERRRKVAPADYAMTIAASAAIIYEVPAEALLPGALKRAAAMDYRDRNGRKKVMTEENWSEVTRQLEQVYVDLKETAKKSRAEGRNPPS